MSLMRGPEDLFWVAHLGSEAAKIHTSFCGTEAAHTRAPILHALAHRSRTRARVRVGGGVQFLPISAGPINQFLQSNDWVSDSVDLQRARMTLRGSHTGEILLLFSVCLCSRDWEQSLIRPPVGLNCKQRGNKHWICEKKNKNNSRTISNNS